MLNAMLVMERHRERRRTLLPWPFQSMRKNIPTLCIVMLLIVTFVHRASIMPCAKTPRTYKNPKGRKPFSRLGM